MMTWGETVFLSSTVLSPCHRFSAPMPGCHGLATLVWSRPLGFGVAFLMAIIPHDGVAA